MEQLRVVRMKSRVSLVIALRDGYVSGPPSDRNMEVRLVQYPRKPIGKPDGTYIFVDLDPGTYRLDISSTYYFRETRDISVGSSNRVIHIPLIPIPSYPYKPNDTLVRAIVAEASGAPLRHAGVTATLLSDDCVKGRISEDKTVKGSDEITVASLTGKIEIGDRFLLVGRGSKEGREIVCIREVLEHQKRFRLESVLTSSYSRGSLLYPIYATKTTERGELAIAFPGGKSSSFKAELRIEREPGVTIAAQEITVAEGQTVNLGTWTV
jgi:hypothetical protein